LAFRQVYVSHILHRSKWLGEAVSKIKAII
jgi:hypothetical protein